MNENKIKIKQYEQAADENVSLGGIKWERKWDVCVQCDSREEAERVRAALTYPEPEPVAWMQDSIELYVVDRPNPFYTIPLYTAPPQRKPLTDKQICEIEKTHLVNYRIPLGGQYDFARAIEAAHGIKEEL